ncbi:MAG: SfiI family type II restriction endonuclease, partial [Hyphomicrobiaceae bacterium]
ELQCEGGGTLLAISTSILVHFYYEKLGDGEKKFRKLKSIFILALPHTRLKNKYNPNPHVTFFGQGKHSPARGEVPRIRVYFSRLRQMCPWRLQELRYEKQSEFSIAEWRDVQSDGSEVVVPFLFLGR